MTAATQSMPREVLAEDQHHLKEMCEELDTPSTEAEHTNLSSAAAITNNLAIVLVDADSKASLHWEKILSMWLSSVIGYFGQHLMDYITGVSEKMEKLEYY